MDRPITSWLRSTYLAHGIVGALLGAAIFLVPGRTLIFLGWVPEMVQLPEGNLSVPGGTFVDSVITRLLGAALLALAWSSFRAWRAKQWSEVMILTELETIYCALGTAACISGFLLLERPMPVIGYVMTLVLALFTLAFGLALRGAVPSIVRRLG